jgi:hypothetical protein
LSPEVNLNTESAEEMIDMKKNVSRSSVERVASAFIGEVLTKPGKVPSYLRKAALVLLDDHFVHTSPIPFMPDEMLNRIQSSETLLPPRAWLDAGNQSPDGLTFLVSLAKHLSAKSVFEIGTYNGVTAWSIARNVSGVMVDTLDLPPTDVPSLPIEDGDHHHRKGFPTREYPLPSDAGKVRQHWGDSSSFDFSPWAGKCDLVYVDGAHSAPYVRADSTNALQMVARSGAIVWDDYWRQIHGVREVMDELSRGRLRGRVWRVPGTRLVVYLPDELKERLAPE